MVEEEAPPTIRESIDSVLDALAIENGLVVASLNECLSQINGIEVQITDLTLQKLALADAKAELEYKINALAETSGKLQNVKDRVCLPEESS